MIIKILSAALFYTFVPHSQLFKNAGLKPQPTIVHTELRVGYICFKSKSE